jgi:hypothetical protein
METARTDFVGDWVRETLPYIIARLLTCELLRLRMTRQNNYECKVGKAMQGQLHSYYPSVLLGRLGKSTSNFSHRT